MIDSLYFSGEDEMQSLVATLVVAVAMIIWAYHKAPVEGNVRRICIGLKTLGIALLLLCLFEPMATEERVEPGANLLALVADTSEGLNLTDAGAKRSRANDLQAALRTKADNWQNRLGEDFELKRYRFDSSLANLSDFDDLAFEGKASRLGHALSTLARRFQGQPLAGIALFTDGVATDLETDLPPLVGLPPVYPVVVGEDSPKPSRSNPLSTSRLPLADDLLRI